MRLLIFTVPHALAFWAAFLWSFSPEFGLVQRARIEAKKKDSRDADSVGVLMTTMWLSLVAAFPLAGMGRTLGEHFTGDVRARAGQPVIQRGPYRWVRHPSYTAGMIMYIGIGLALTNWLSLGILLIAAIAGYAYRVRVEERALLAEIGASYAEYMRTRKRFVPFII